MPWREENVGRALFVVGSRHCYVQIRSPILLTFELVKNDRNLWDGRYVKSFSEGSWVGIFSLILCLRVRSDYLTIVLGGFWKLEFFHRRGGFSDLYPLGYFVFWSGRNLVSYCMVLMPVDHMINVLLRISRHNSLL